jgi:hypothetical protein
MSFRATVLRRSCLALLILGLGATSPAFGQAKNSPVAFSNQDAITTAFVDPPVTTGSAGGTASNANGNTQWLKVEIHYGATDALTTPYLDSVTIKVWIEGRDSSVANSQGTKGIAIVLTGEVTYVNIAQSKDVYGVFYVHPSTLARYSGDGGYEDFDRKFDIHAQLSVGGAVMDDINKGKEPDPVILTWFTKLKAIPNLVYRQDQSPFLSADVDRYPAIKLQAAAAQ